MSKGQWEGRERELHKALYLCFVLRMANFTHFSHLTPRPHPPATLFFTYIIPIIPFILVFDGYISAYRSRSFSHIQYLAQCASTELTKQGKRPVGGQEWVWEQGEREHTWPGGKMYYVIGKRGDLEK